MSKPKHTPAPWLYRPNDPAYGYQSPYMVWTSKGPGYGTVATTVLAGLMPTDPEQQAADAALIASAPDLELMLWAITQGGWEPERVSLYDEEGVEGWRWTGPNGREVYAVGDWNEVPAISDRLRDALLADRYGDSPEVAAEKNQTNKFVEFLEKILTDKTNTEEKK